MRWHGLCFVVASVSCIAVAASDNTIYKATVSASLLGANQTAQALQHLVALVLTEAGVPASLEPDKHCSPRDSQLCIVSALRPLAEDAVVALMSRPANTAGIAPTAWQLREVGIEELGDIAPPSRRACLTALTKTPARSLLDLQDPKIASAYHIPDDVIAHELATHSATCVSCNISAIVPERCQGEQQCATLMTSSESEAAVLEAVIRLKQLYAVVRPVGDLLPVIARELISRPVIFCDWAPELTALAEIPSKLLGPPPCLSTKPCPFESRRFVKYVNIKQLAHAPSAIQALERLQLNSADMQKISKLAQVKGPEVAAREFLKDHPIDTLGIREVRVAVMLSYKTKRETYDGRALHVTAALFEKDFNENRSLDLPQFKIEAYDDQCNTAQAYKYLTNAPASEYQALTAIAGPACGAAWGAVVPLSPAHRLPMLAYTPQAPTVVEGDRVGSVTGLQLLAAGDSTESGKAASAFLAWARWRRVAVLSESATKAIVDPIREHASLEVHVELPEGEDVDRESVREWATRSSAANLRILYVCLEDARAIREAFCSGRAAGLAPTSGVVWILCTTPERDWLQTNDQDDCTRDELEEIASGFITVTQEWEENWKIRSKNVSSERKDWETRWFKQCRTQNDGEDCQRPGPDAAMLYDVLQLWGQTLDALMLGDPKAVRDLHNPKHVRWLISNATTTPFHGLTGHFNWTTNEDSYTRKGELVLSQWFKDGVSNIGRYKEGHCEIEEGNIQWQTTDGRVPDDGGERCAVEGLSRAMGTECRAAWATLGSVLAAVLFGALAALGLHCRRRAEREYRERLAALGMRPLANKPSGFDKWEVPRERVVINRKLGTGAFGTVYGGHAMLSPDKWTAVAVKTLKAGATTEEKLDFLSEAEAMKRFDHKNVVRLLGVVTNTEPVCTVMEFMLYGDLKSKASLYDVNEKGKKHIVECMYETNADVDHVMKVKSNAWGNKKGYLLARRGLAAGDGGADCADEVSPRRLTSMALDVARALSYLAQLRYVHRDVAARNCLVSARRVVKLADFGMTRLVFENDYYRFSRKGMLPVRWMAPESLALGVFSPASDVWSFGVLLYEIVTFGSLPYQGYSNSEVLTRVKGGQTLELPPGLKPQLEGLIKSCWQQDSKTRPTACEVAAFLADAPRLLAPCLDIPLDALPLDADPPWRLPRDQAEARWISWAAPGSAATDTTYLSSDGPDPIALDTDSFLP